MLTRIAILFFVSTQASALTIECRNLNQLSGVSSVKWSSTVNSGTFKINQFFNGQNIEKVVSGIETATLEPISSQAINSISINPLMLDEALKHNSTKVEGFYSHTNLLTNIQEVGFWIFCDLQNN